MFAVCRFTFADSQLPPLGGWGVKKSPAEAGPDGTPFYDELTLLRIKVFNEIKKGAQGSDQPSHSML